MKHARDDYNRIQDPENQIPEDEPVFLLRAQDEVAPIAVDAWACALRARGGDETVIREAFAQAGKMRDWQQKHGSKLPDSPTGS